MTTRKSPFHGWVRRSEEDPSRNNPLAFWVMVMLFAIGFSSLGYVVISEYICPQFPGWVCDVHNDTSTIGNFIEWFGVLYGLLAALVLVNVWVQNEMVVRDFDREADAVHEFCRTLCFLKEDLLIAAGVKKTVVQSLALEYAEHVYAWYMVEGAKTKTGGLKKDKGDELLRNIQAQISEIVHSGEETTVKTELLRQINQIVDIRGDRIADSQQRIPLVLKSLLILSSFIWVVPFLFLTIENPLLGWMMPITVITVVTWIIGIIYDLDNPFTGSLKISTDSWVELIKDIKFDIEETSKATSQPSGRRTAPSAHQRPPGRSRPLTNKPVTYITRSIHHRRIKN